MINCIDCKFWDKIPDYECNFHLSNHHKCIMLRSADVMKNNPDMPIFIGPEYHEDAHLYPHADFGCVLGVKR